MDEDRLRRAEERRLMREKEREAKLMGGMPAIHEKRVEIDAIFGKLAEVRKSIDENNILKVDLWVDGVRQTKLRAGSKITLLPEGHPTPTVLIAQESADAAKDALCKKEQSRVFTQSGMWVDSQAAERAAERQKQEAERAAQFGRVRIAGSVGDPLGLPPWSNDIYYELRDWSGIQWPYCLLCRKFADEDHVASEKHLKRVPYYLDYLPPEHIRKIMQPQIMQPLPALTAPTTFSSPTAPPGVRLSPPSIAPVPQPVSTTAAQDSASCK